MELYFPHVVGYFSYRSFAVQFEVSSGPRRLNEVLFSGSRYQSIFELTEPSQPMTSDDVSDEDGPQHRKLRPLLFFSCCPGRHRDVSSSGLPLHAENSYFRGEGRVVTFGILPCQNTAVHLLQ